MPHPRVSSDPDILAVGAADVRRIEGRFLNVGTRKINLAAVFVEGEDPFFGCNPQFVPRRLADHIDVAVEDTVVHALQSENHCGGAIVPHQSAVGRNPDIALAVAEKHPYRIGRQEFGRNVSEGQAFRRGCREARQDREHRRQKHPESGECKFLFHKSGRFSPL